MKKIASLFLIVLSLLVLVACGTKKFTVTFVNEGGSDVAPQEVKKGDFALKPTPDPTTTKEDVVFRGWSETADGGETSSLFVFETTAITKDTTLYAVWVDKAKVLLSFNTKVANLTVPSQSLVKGEDVTTAPTAPERAGYRFGGWYLNKAGYLWSELEAYQFGGVLNEDLQLHAYWEPLNSKSVKYTAAETYKASLSAGVSHTNPLTYTDGLAKDLFDLMSAGLYSTEIDWDKAVKDGVASKEGDFSKIASGEFSIEALDYKYILLNGTKFPVDKDGEDYLDVNGNYDRDAAALAQSTEWTFEIREDIKFEDGTPIDAYTYEYALQQFLDPDQLNYRAALYMDAAGGTAGTPIKNARAYYEQRSDGKPAVAWSEVGFKVVSKYKFTITLEKEISQQDAVAFSGIKLVHPAKYAAGFNDQKTATNYGTIENPFVSYGPYILATWDSGQKYVFNKNYDFVHKHRYTYKAMEYQIIETEDDRMKFYNEGKLNVVGLGATYYSQFANDPNVYKTPSANLQNLTFNLYPRGDKKATPEILKELDFRWALYYGFNRKGYNDTAYAPNSASTTFLSSITKQFLMGDPYTYAESTAFKALVDKYELSTETYGYVPEKAKALFDKAYAASGSTGVIKLDMPYPNYEHIKRAAEYIKDMYEGLFGKDKIEIVLNPLADEAMDVAMIQRNFDINISFVGYGVSYAAFLQIPGLFIDTKDNEMGLPEGFNLEEKILTVDMPYLYDLLNSLEAEELNAQDKALLELFDSNGRITGVTAVSFYRTYVSSYARWWSTSASYSGATEDLSNLTAAFEDIIWQAVPVIPVSSRGSATLYKDVFISWPAWSQLFGWGPQAYRYLKSDPDFQ